MNSSVKNNVSLMRSLYHLYQGYKGIKGGNLYISFCVFFLSILSLSSCSPTKQISYKGEQGVKWEVYNSFSFLPVECGEVPASINSSIIQCIQEGIIQEMDKKGYGHRGWDKRPCYSSSHLFQEILFCECE